MVGRSSSLRKIVVFSCILFACSEAEQPKRTATVFACDNALVSSTGSPPCFASKDPKYMTIALRPQPASLSGSTIRLRDPGEGLTAEVLGEQSKMGTTWYKLNINGKVGWVAEHLVRLD